MKKILLVEDDPAILKGLTVSLEAENYIIKSASDGEKGHQLAKNENVDLIILDIMLPSKNGLDICSDLRKDGINTPILMLTSKKDEIDKVLGLEIGADDYVTKPFSLRELQARIKAILRRKSELAKSIDDFSFDGINLDFKKMEASKNGRLIKLSALEFKILKYLIEREGDVVSRDKLLDDVWGYEAFPTTRTVDNYILSIRKKIENNPAEPVHILTMHKSGYKFVK
ncbi:MAG: response regulator transcription factor [Bacteroidetes bacterium]|nr:response regulator transcription factor [Bacteroidota bacterium]